MKADPILLALTGCVSDPGSGSLIERLAGLGWDVEQVREFALSQQAKHLPWPLPVPGELLPNGRAAFAAALGEARAELGLIGPVQPPPRIRPLSAEENRLAADRPPHWE